MALAEVGFDPAGLMLIDGRLVFDRRIVPRPIAWRTRSVTRFGRPICLACFVALAGDADCWAVSHHERDCGRPTRATVGQ